MTLLAKKFLTFKNLRRLGALGPSALVIIKFLRQESSLDISLLTKLLAKKFLTLKTYQDSGIQLLKKYFDSRASLPRQGILHKHRPRSCEAIRSHLDVSPAALSDFIILGEGSGLEHRLRGVGEEPVEREQTVLESIGKISSMYTWFAGKVETHDYKKWHQNLLGLYTKCWLLTQKNDQNIGFQEKKSFFAEYWQTSPKIVIISCTLDPWRKISFQRLSIIKD
jgi:hypothetical protein